VNNLTIAVNDIDLVSLAQHSDDCSGSVIPFMCGSTSATFSPDPGISSPVTTFLFIVSRTTSAGSGLTASAVVLGESSVLISAATLVSDSTPFSTLFSNFSADFFKADFSFVGGTLALTVPGF